MYVAIEGIDCAGKTTQIEELKKIYKEAVFTCEPGGTEVGEKIRQIALKDRLSALGRAFLFLADRAEHAEHILSPNIDKLIISDRSLISGVAYAWDDLPTETAKTLNLLATKQIAPNLAILLELDEQTLQTRLARQRPDEIEKQGAKTLLAIQERFKDAAQLLGVTLVPINAVLPIEKIAENIKELIDDYGA
ncbi:MAG: dTMP kinase [Helicobacteraceae bacterium]|jgi:dTMP kinase|nr:dTMP kinase [Helicobacteraceae bacterium]